MGDENRLDQFGNSPRAFLNNGQTTTVNSSSLIQLGPGLVATRPAVPEGQSSFMRIDAPNLTQVDSLTERVTVLELGLQVPDPYVAPSGKETLTAIVGATHQVDSSALGFDEGTAVQLPLATATNKGQSITIQEISGNALDKGSDDGGASAYLKIVAPPSQPTLRGVSTGPGGAYYLLTSPSFAFPFATFRSTGDAWVCVSRSSF